MDISVGIACSDWLITLNNPAQLKRLRPFILYLAVGLFIVLLLRGCCFGVLTISSDSGHPSLLSGDRVLINRFSYGLRLPLSRYLGYHRLGGHSYPACGDWIAFNQPLVRRDALPDTSAVYVGLVLACPGDTVWMGPDGRISPRRSYSRGCIWPLRVPAAGTQINMSPWSVSLYSSTITRFEPQVPESLVEGLRTDGRNTSYYTFRHNYFWVFSGHESDLLDSRTFGFIPEEFIQGRVEMVLYSLDSRQPFYRSLRTHRMFTPVN